MTLYTPDRGNQYMLFLMFYQIFLSISYALFNQYIGFPDWLTDISILVINQFLTFLVPFFFYLLLTRQSIWEALPIKKLNPVNTGLIFLMCITVQPIMALLSALSSMFYRNNMGDLMERLYSYPFLIVMAAISFVPAICEEINFRGIILTNYKHNSIKKAAIINGFFFGVAHFDLQQFLYAFAMGVLFAYFVYYTKSILASIFAHFTINSIQLGISYAASSMPEVPQETVSSADILSAILYLCIMSAIFLPIFMILFKAFISLNRRKNLIEEMHIQLSGHMSRPEHIQIEDRYVLTPAFWGVIVVFAVFILLNAISMLMPFL